MEELDIEIGLKLKKLREDLGISQREVARRIDMDNSYLAKIEKGKMPSLEKLKKICALYGITIQSLFGEEIEVPNILKELGVGWITHAKKMKEKNLTPEDVEKMVEVIRSLKNI
jgi:transcriptional regulator with XRE-family HTH domain